MGDAESRAAYVEALRAYLLDHADALGAEFRERVEANPLRVLDTKRADWQDVIEHAPQLTEYLTDASRDALRAGAGGAPGARASRTSSRRGSSAGFDYYTSTTFEFQSDALDAAQNALGGGGRYDRLAEEMGGPPTPGHRLRRSGIERLLIALRRRRRVRRRRRRARRRVRRQRPRPSGGTEVTVLVSELREDGLRAERAYGGRSVKAQWKAADRSGARVRRDARARRSRARTRSR